MNYIPEEVLKAYAEPHRRFHIIDHVYNMLDYCLLAKPTQNKHLFHAILWHDFVYNPSKKDNEEKSAEAWLRFNKENNCYTELNCGSVDDFDVGYVAELILSTKEPFKEYSDTNKTLINKADFNVFIQDREALIEYENQIFYEFQKYPVEEYRDGRLIFLSKFLTKCSTGCKEYSNVEFLLNYVQNKQYKIGIYAGSFNPFHIGHLDIIKQAEGVFDKVIIAQGYNQDKEKPVLIHDAIQETIVYDGLLADVFKDNDNYTLVRGLRNSNDLNSEISLKQTLVELSLSNPIVYFVSKPELQHISSSMIRSLYPFGEETYERYLV